VRSLSALLVLVTTLVSAVPADVIAESQPPAPLAPDQRVLARVNSYRARAGLAPVVLDPQLSKGCMEHAQYMKLNRGTDAMSGLNPHHQRPDLPGASKAGAVCGENADLYPEVSDLDQTVDDWMASLYHRRPVLSPQLTRIGFGYATLADGLYTAALMFAPAEDRPDGWPVRFPADKQTEVGLALGNEIPRPIPADAIGGGYPITIQFPPFDAVTAVTATLVDAAGAAVPFYLSDPEQPASSFGQYGVVCLIPRQALAPSTSYTASVTATWQAKPATYTWSFTTLALRVLDADDEVAMLAAQHVPSRVHGRVIDGGMMDTATAYLVIGHDKPTHYEMLSVLVPIAAWRTLAGAAAPAQWVGKAIEVAATPELTDGVYLNLSITSPAQLTVVTPPS
jgi:hypothetical protein